MAAHYKFYKEDCVSVGVIPTKETKKLPISHPLNIPNFNEDGPSRGLLMDELLEHLSFRVANIVNYNENESRLLEHINQGSSELFLNFIVQHYEAHN